MTRELQALSHITRLIREAKINLTTHEFIKVYSENKGIKNHPVNVWNNIEKYQLMLKGNYKYLYRILNEPNFLNNLGDSFKI